MFAFSNLKRISSVNIVCFPVFSFCVCLVVVDVVVVVVVVVVVHSLKLQVSWQYSQW